MVGTIERWWWRWCLRLGEFGEMWWRTWLLTLCLFVGSENLGIGRVNERVFIWSFEIKRKVRRKMRGKWVGNKERQRERGRFFVLF